MTVACGLVDIEHRRRDCRVIIMIARSLCECRPLAMCARSVHYRCVVPQHLREPVHPTRASRSRCPLLPPLLQVECAGPTLLLNSNGENDAPLDLTRAMMYWPHNMRRTMEFIAAPSGLSTGARRLRSCTAVHYSGSRRQIPGLEVASKRYSRPAVAQTRPSSLPRTELLRTGRQPTHSHGGSS